MYVIGLTGGVGSGKTEAAHILGKLADADVLIADELGHKVMEKGEAGYDKIRNAFGSDILDENGEINRAVLAEIVFAKEDLLEKLNGIIHPAVYQYVKAYIEERKNEKGFLVLETAIMFETECDKLCDEIWYVRVPEHIRRERLAKNRGYSEKKSRSIMKKQLTEEAFAKRCHRQVENAGTLEELEEELQKNITEFQREHGALPE